MKNKGIIIPVALAGIVLVLVFVTAFTKKDFKRSPAETLQLASGNSNLLGPADISSLSVNQVEIIKIGLGKLPPFSSEIEVKDLDITNLLSPETKALFSDNKKKKLFFSVNLADAVKAWTFLTRMGYNELYIYDPDYKAQVGQNDTVPHGNEELRYIFKPKKSESE